ncbi:MAG: hypothetical protein WCK99_11500 [Mycobacteriaceae bacterium]
MSVSNRSMLLPGIAAATVGALVLSPALVAPPAALPARVEVQVPVVHIQDIQLAGIGRDFYNSVSAVAQGVAQWAEWTVGLIPFLGSGIAGQININYARLIQPLIANTVYALSDIIANPLGILTTAGLYISNQVYIGYTWVASQVRFFGLPPILGPIPTPQPLASVGSSSAPTAAARIAGPRATAAARTSAAARVGRGELRIVARTAVEGTAKTARAAAVRSARAVAAKPEVAAGKAVANAAS